jgi:hypothetical protein
MERITEKYIWGIPDSNGYRFDISPKTIFEFLNANNNAIRKIPEYQCTPLTEGFLVAYYPKFHKKKILDRILSSKKEVLENAISVDRFLKMGEEEFKKFQNY